MTDVLITIFNEELKFQFDIPTATARGFNLDMVDAEDSWDTDVADINCLTIEVANTDQLSEVFENLWPELWAGRDEELAEIIKKLGYVPTVEDFDGEPEPAVEITDEQFKKLEDWITKKE